MNLKPLIFASTIALAISGCNSSSSGGGASLEVIGVSGNTVNLDGAWARPCRTDTNSNPVVDILSKHVFSGSSASITESSFSSTDASCSGTETVLYTIELTATAGTTTAITGWVNGMGGPATAPQAQDGSGALGDNESVTVISATITAAPPGPDAPPVGAKFDLFYVVDDTVPTAPIMYGDTDYATGATTADAFDHLALQ
ncbi:MAG: hypothetical protein OEZ38_01180 [Gammaproteobacteria bacterium]|nr:hypothetical protein [Gammaproteobacteria bacterium]